MFDHPRRRRRRAQVHDAAQRPARRNRGAHDPSRIDRFEARAFERSRQRVQEPPRDAVHRGKHRRIRGEERADMCGDLGHRLALDRDDDQVLVAKHARILCGPNRGLKAAPAEAQLETAALQRFERRTARHRAYLGETRRGNSRAKEAADRTRAIDADLHAPIMPSQAGAGNCNSNCRLAAQPGCWTRLLIAWQSGRSALRSLPSTAALLDL